MKKSKRKYTKRTPKEVFEKAPPVPLRVAILNRGAEITVGNRQEIYGEATRNMEHYAGLLTAYFKNKLCDWDAEPSTYHFTAEDAAMIMVIAKLSRVAGTGPFHEDNYVDGATYTAIAGECRAKQEGR